MKLALRSDERIVQWCVSTWMPFTPRHVHSRVEVTGLVASAAGDASRDEREAGAGEAAPEPAPPDLPAQPTSATVSAAPSDHAASAARAEDAREATLDQGLTASA